MFVLNCFHVLRGNLVTTAARTADYDDYVSLGGSAPGGFSPAGATSSSALALFFSVAPYSV